jgi:hypothetical protein
MTKAARSRRIGELVHAPMKAGPSREWRSTEAEQGH